LAGPAHSLRDSRLDRRTIYTAYGIPGGDGGWSIENATQMDVHPTVLDFLGIKLDSRGITGRSQL